MKLRHKRVLMQRDYKLLDESTRNYVCEGEKGEVVLLSKEDYEPIPEEHWVDVTRECEMPTLLTTPYCEIWYEGTRLVHLAPDSGYRFVKKHFLWQDAFVVEKKESR